MEAVEGTGDAPLHATNELNLKQVLVNNDQFPYFFSLRACGNSFAKRMQASPFMADLIHRNAPQGTAPQEMPPYGHTSAGPFEGHERSIRDKNAFEPL
jgi:hypothetical protein